MAHVNANRDHGAYFAWQLPLGEFGGWANRTKFAKYVDENSDVLDFGCGGGFLLASLRCRRKVGVEPSPVAAELARSNGLEVVCHTADLPDESIDVVISDNALEHVLDPLSELKTLHGKLRYGGRIIIVVPCEAISYRYRPNDINHHLFSWSPMDIGNLLSEAGFSVIESKPYIHKWPPLYRAIARLGGRSVFEIACRVYGRVGRSWFQVRAVGEKTAE